MSLVGHIEATTKKKFDKKLTSQVIFHAPFFMRLWKRARVRGGGTKHVWHPRYARRTTQHYGRYTLLDRKATEFITEAELAYVYSNTTGQLAGQDVSENTPAERVLDLLAEELAAMRDDCIYDFSSQIWTGAGGLYPSGITNASTGGAVATSPSGTTYANIVRDTDDAGSGDFTNWFSNQYKDASGAAITLDLMEEAYLKPCQGNYKPTLCVTSKDGFRKLWNKATDIQRLGDKDLAKLGFESMHFNNMLVVWDDHCPVGATTGKKARYYMLHEPDIHLIFVKGRKMKRKPWFEPENQDAMVTDIRNGYVLAVHTPKIHCVLFDVKEN